MKYDIVVVSKPPAPEVDLHCMPDPAGAELLSQAIRKLGLSARGSTELGDPVDALVFRLIGTTELALRDVTVDRNKIGAATLGIEERCDVEFRVVWRAVPASGDPR